MLLYLSRDSVETKANMTTKATCLYKTLGVNRDATVDQIKQAFRAKSMKHHPDRNPGDKRAAERFQKVVLAYRVLSDSERRKRYDETGDIQDAPDNRASKLVSTLSQVFQMVLTKLLERNLDPKQQDMPALMVDYCTHHLAELVQRKQALAKAKQLILALQGRFSAKQGANYMEEVTAFEATKLDRELAHLAEVEQVTKDTLDWLKGCSFKRDDDLMAQLRKAMVNGHSTTFKVAFQFGG
jgi:curved DNA-binding protein CbpA